MIRVILSIWIFIGSLAGLLVSGMVISSTLAAYPTDHIHLFGPTVSNASETMARWLPHAWVVLNGAGLASVAIALYFWRSGRSREIKSFAVTLLAAINYWLALFAVMGLVVAYFLLPKVANVA
jgi:hypothetical protein